MQVTPTNSAYFIFFEKNSAVITQKAIINPSFYVYFRPPFWYSALSFGGLLSYGGDTL